jgi:hypothetical protein
LKFYCIVIVAKSPKSLIDLLLLRDKNESISREIKTISREIKPVFWEKSGYFQSKNNNFRTLDLAQTKMS